EPARQFASRSYLLSHRREFEVSFRNFVLLAFPMPVREEKISQEVTSLPSQQSIQKKTNARTPGSVVTAEPRRRFSGESAAFALNTEQKDSIRYASGTLEKPLLARHVMEIEKKFTNASETAELSRENCEFPVSIDVDFFQNGPEPGQFQHRVVTRHNNADTGTAEPPERIED